MNFFKDCVRFDPVNHYILLTKEELQKLKKNIRPEQLEFLKQNLSYMNASPLRSVVDKLGEIPPSFDKHDYVSLATYYWPNPETENGLPYVARDGHSNPEGESFDKDGLRELAFLVYTYAILYYLTEDVLYYETLKKHLVHYFIDSTTRMNPNMNHGQMIKGVNEGRGIGMIDYTGNMAYAIYMLKQLYKLGYLEEEFYQELKEWHQAFYHWMKFSPIALEERYATNNHGSMYVLGCAIVADFIDEKEDMLPYVYHMVEYHMVKQFAEDGSLPQELKRTKSKSYSLMGLKAFTDFAIICSQYQIDLINMDWYYKKLKPFIRLGVDYLKEKLIYKQDWVYPQITIFDEATLLPLIYFSEVYLHQESCFEQVHIDKIHNIILLEIYKTVTTVKR